MLADRVCSVHDCSPQERKDQYDLSQLRENAKDEQDSHDEGAWKGKNLLLFFSGSLSLRGGPVVLVRRTVGALLRRQRQQVLFTAVSIGLAF